MTTKSFTRYGMTEVQICDIKAFMLHGANHGERNARTLAREATHFVRFLDETVAPLPSVEQARDIIAYAKNITA